MSIIVVCYAIVWIEQNVTLWPNTIFFKPKHQSTEWDSCGKYTFQYYSALKKNYLCMVLLISFKILIKVQYNLIEII